MRPDCSFAPTQLARQLPSRVRSSRVRSSPLCALVARLSLLVVAVCTCCTTQSPGRRCVHLLHDSVSWSSLCALVARLSPAPRWSLPPPFLSAAQSPPRANSTGIRLLSSVPHLWSSSFDCPASPGKEKTKCDRIAPSHPLSWPCVSDLLATTSKARAGYALKPSMTRLHNEELVN